MKYSISNIWLLFVIVAMLYFLQTEGISVLQKNLAGGLCLLIGIFYLLKIYFSYKSGRISTGISVFNWGARSSTKNNFIGDTFERSIDSKHFHSAVRGSVYIAIIFIGLGLIVLLGLI